MTVRVLARNLERGLQAIKSRCERLARSEHDQVERSRGQPTVIAKRASSQQTRASSASSDDDDDDDDDERTPPAAGPSSRPDGAPETTATNGPATAEARHSRRAGALRQRQRRLNALLNSMPAIKFKMLLFALALAHLSQWLPVAQAGFFTFYFPNILKPKGFGELSDMVSALDAQMNQTRDVFADTQYFWGQMQQLDAIKSDYPEESACSEVFPMFRELAIAYTYADFDHYMSPFEQYRAHLLDCRKEWYPAGLESKAALPREWEQKLHEFELELKIEWLERLASTQLFQEQRAKMNEIWTSVRRGLDASMPCIYLRYAYRQISEDINQVALESNLEGMRQALKVLQAAYKRIAKFKESDRKVVEDIEEEFKKVERFTIRKD